MESRAGGVLRIAAAGPAGAQQAADAELSEAEIEDIAAFLRTLTGEMPELRHPQLPERGPHTPLPEPM